MYLHRIRLLTNIFQKKFHGGLAACGVPFHTVVTDLKDSHSKPAPTGGTYLLVGVFGEVVGVPDSIIANFSRVCWCLTRTCQICLQFCTEVCINIIALSNFIFINLFIIDSIFISRLKEF